MSDKKKSMYGFKQEKEQGQQGKDEQNALMSLVFGIIGAALSCGGFGVVFGIIAIGFGFLGLKSKEKKKYAIIGIILGIVSIVMLVVVALMNLTNQSAA